MSASDEDDEAMGGGVEDGVFPQTDDEDDESGGEEEEEDALVVDEDAMAHSDGEMAGGGAGVARAVTAASRQQRHQTPAAPVMSKAAIMVGGGVLAGAAAGGSSSGDEEGGAGGGGGGGGGGGEGNWLPQCKIKRNYICHCNYFTQNPRLYLYHLRDVHGERIRVYECPNCLYASKHSQKLQRHIHMVHVVGSTKGGGAAGNSGGAGGNHGTTTGTPKATVSARKGGGGAVAAASAEKKRPGGVGASPAAATAAALGGSAVGMVSAAAHVDVDEEEAEMVGEGAAGAFGAQSPSATFRCSACSFSSRSRSLVMRHEHIAHVLKKRFFRCGKCSYATHVKARYTKHVKYHSMPMIKCERCDFRTPYKWNLDRHCKNHLSDPSANTPGAFRCPICDFSADIKQSLTVHVQNHHLSPEQVQARAARRRNKVGASDSAEAEAAAISAGGTIDSEEMELLRMEREENYFQGGTYGRMSLDSSRASLLQTPEEPTRVSTPSSTGSNKLKVTIKKMRGPSAAQEQNERHNFRTDFIHPDDIIQKNGQVYIKTLKCNYCNFKAAWDGDILRHEAKAHGIEHPKPIPKSTPIAVNNKKCPRPVPNLIPIQGKATAPVSPSASTNLPILRIPTLKGRALNDEAPAQTEVEVTMSDKDMNALINAESSRNSALKDFASLIGDLPDDADGTSRPCTPPKNSAASDGGGEGGEPVGTPETVNSEPTSISPPTPSKKTCASFFDRLKERLLVGGGDGLVCEICGHESKCLSEKARHQKLHDSTPEGMQLEESVTPTSTPGKRNRLIAGGNALMALSSTRCQHCRQRCKTSADLMVHLQSCLNSSKEEKGEGEDDEEEEARNAKKAAEDEKQKSLKAKAEAAKEAIKQAIKESMEGEDEDEEGDEDEEPEEGEDGEPHPMENKVFVWNNCAQAGESSVSGGTGTQASSASDGEGAGPQSGEDLSGAYADDGEGLVGVETAPGIGAITGRGGYEGGISPGGKVTTKKVFKCPQCPFWASTASRFHVHAVGHLNRKPFECSACGYRSNWRWDITKHIRLRAAWDEAHRSPPEGSDGSAPRVLMTDETGRRNYSKYNRHLTVVRVHEMLSSEQGTGGEGSPLSSPLPQPPPVENGKMVNKSMVMLLPAPPRLTPAPIQPANAVEDGESMPPLLRPPPPLRAAASSTSAVRRPNLMSANSETRVQAEGVTARGVKRPAASGQGGETKEGGSTKRTLWKCKKCNYRDASRELILAHVRQHYAAPNQPPPSRPPPPLQQQPKVSEQKMDTEDGSEPMDIGGDEPLHIGKGGEIKPYQCGHCGRISNWKHVIQRHCRLKHNGVVLVIEQPNTAEEENMDPSNSWKCDKCPYRAADLIELQTHATHHIQRPGAVFKCSFCPYFVFERTHLVGHMRLHTANMLSKSLDHQDEQEEPTKEEMKKSEGSEGGKRYSCVGCPYVSDSKSQFLYHKQFHRPRGVAPFKCSFCSYSVSRRHLLHQHLRVHGVSVPANMREDEPRVEAAKRSSISRPSQPVLDTSRLTDVPLVWVSRAGKFQKMFKCRFCPHVNVRKINIQEHEKMHKQRKAFPLNPRQGQLMSGMDSPQGNSPKVGASPHKCPQCNYSCNNAGVLSAHAKVHLDSYGKVHCLVDVNRADEEQIAELEANAMLGSMEPSDSDGVSVTIGGINRSANGMGSGGSNSIGVGGSSGIGGGVPNHVGAGGQASPEEDLTECAPEVPDNSVESPEGHILHFCPSCPARFVFERELVIHRRFHGIRLPFKCEVCSYAARQRPHLLAHLKVHTREYQEKSAALMTNHTVSSHHPRPRIATAVPNDAMNPESMWIVDPKPQPSSQVTQENSSEVPQGSVSVSSPATQPNKHYACVRCPARFFKSVALQYHLTLHGGPGPYRCRTCDYAVKTYGNLVRHEMIHGSGDLPSNRNTSASHSSPAVIPLSGTDLFRQREAAGQAENIPRSPTTPAPTQVTPSSVPPTVDPQFGTLMHGNPDFIYPTYFKNGKLKEKRYKCHKCPSAFEKREQYKVHLSLHGSKQRYRCDKCDYAVKYCANYIQHVRKHTRCEEARLARQQQQNESTGGVVQNLNFETPTMPMPVVPAPTPSSTHSSPSRPVKSIAPAVPPALSMAEKQQALLRRLRLEAAGAQEREEEERRKRNVFLCLRCPYNTHRKDSLEAHMRRHPGATELSVGSSQFPCPFCDYAAPQSHFLREHIKLHFRATKTLPKPEAYLSIEKVEVWEGDSKEDGNLIFRDTGKEGFERFLPPDDGSEMEEGADDSGRTYVDPESGEIVQALEVSSESSVLGQTGEEAVEMKEEDASDTKGKDLGGDWTIDVLDEDDSSRDGEEVENKTMECTSVD